MASRTTTIRVGKVALLIGGAIWTLVSGVIGALLKDEVRDRIAPIDVSATMGTPRLQPGVRFGQYLKDVGARDEPLSDARKRALERMGMVVFARVTTKGFKADGLIVRGAVLTENGAELSELNPLNWGFTYKPAANSDSTVANIWLPKPVQPGRYKVVVRVFEDYDHAPFRAEKESTVFAVSEAS